MSEVSGGDDRDGARSAGPTPLARVAGRLPTATRLALRAVPDSSRPGLLTEEAGRQRTLEAEEKITRSTEHAHLRGRTSSVSALARPPGGAAGSRRQPVPRLAWRRPPRRSLIRRSRGTGLRWAGTKPTTTRVPPWEARAVCTCASRCASSGPSRSVSYWRQLQNLPQVHAPSRAGQRDRRRLVALGRPRTAGLRVEWDAEIINESPIA